VIRPMRHLTLPGAGLREQVVGRGFRNSYDLLGLGTPLMVEVIFR
jgi:hypothetical protein